MNLIEFDRQYLNENTALIGGTDEAGRGPLAGPVSVAAVVMPLGEGSIIEGINDSKKVPEKKRELLYELIIERAVSYSIVLIDHNEIDEINILEATKKGMYGAYEGLSVKPNIFLIDAVKLNIPNSISLIHGDALSYNIACASILAKVSRDRLMREYARTYPEYGFEKHKGYGTALHYAALEKHGVTPIHRMSFLGSFFEREGVADIRIKGVNENG